LLVYPFQCVSVTTNLFLGPITQLFVPEYNCSHSRLVGKHSRNAVGGHGAFYESVFSPCLEGLWRQFREELLFPPASPKSARYHEVVAGITSTPAGIFCSVFTSLPLASMSLCDGVPERGVAPASRLLYIRANTGTDTST
jgi:hypothetical protein